MKIEKNHPSVTLVKLPTRGADPPQGRLLAVPEMNSGERWRECRQG
jgi:hypothetical protein